ncbi:MAG: hypothetical protein ACLR8P_02830 [Clostridium fessum]
MEGQENPLPAIDAASVQEVQNHTVSMWNANYDCLFFCINQRYLRQPDTGAAGSSR